MYSNRVFTLLTASFAAGLATQHPTTSAPIPPTQDPFYTAPAGYESAAPGTILRARIAPGNLTTIIRNSSAAYNLLYRTTDTRYRPSWAVTTLFLPSIHKSSSNASLPLLSYQVAYDSIDIDNGPSYGLYNQYSQSIADGIPPVSEDIVDSLGLGWAVSVPDYEGPFGSAVAGVQEGHATIDSVRAVLSLGANPNPWAHILKLPARITQYALWGYSGGGIASEYAAELATQYAPELTFAGVAMGGIVPNMTSAVDAINETPAAGAIPLFLIGALNQYSEAYNYLVSHLKSTGPYNKTGFLAAQEYTLLEGTVAFGGQDIYNYFVDGAATLKAPVIRSAINSNGYMGYHGTPQMPLFVYKAINDSFGSIKDSDELVERYCGVGANIVYRRNTVGGHTAESINGRPAAMEFLKKVLGGSYNSPGCITETVTVNLTSIEV